MTCLTPSSSLTAAESLGAKRPRRIATRGFGGAPRKPPTRTGEVNTMEKPLNSTDFEEHDHDTPTEADLDQAYGSKYLSASDVGDRKIKTAIKKIRKGDFRNSDGTRETKFVLYFENLDKPMVLNATNVETLVEALGRVPGKWVGAVIGIYVDRNVTFGGKRVAGLRLRVLAPTATKPESSPQNDSGLTDMDDDIPF
jgi:hypothetical protein